MSREVNRTIKILVIFCITFVALVVYLSYFQIFKAESIKNNSYNKRLWINEENVLRGSIIDRNNITLAYSEKNNGKNIRHYKYGNLYSHVIGYSYREYGKAGLELSYNNQLLGIRGNTGLDEIKDLVLPNSVGYDLRLTIDHGLQEKAYALMGGKKGSIVVINPKTGEVYAMANFPNFDVSNLTDKWKEIIESKDSPLLNRATQGLYEPGSVFKIITTAAILETSDIDLTYECKGKIKIDGYQINDYKGQAHGKIDLSDAFVKSCNGYYASKSLAVGKNNLGNMAERFMFNKKISFDLSTKNTSYPYKNTMKDTELASSSIGQGKVIVTPINMALVASAIANNGNMMKPILVKEILNNNQVIRSYQPEVMSQSIDMSIASEIKDMMLDVVNYGTGTSAKIKNIDVAGKTGTAENPSGQDHSWFVGFAPFDNPQIALAVIVEEAGETGGRLAAPIAKELISYALKNIKF